MQMAPPRFTVGDIEVDTDRNLLRTVDGEIHVEPKVMDVLRLLAGRQGEVVARGELIETIWQVEYGADESLTRAISHLRKAFGDTRDAPRFIETIAKRGYRLITPVTIADPAPTAATAEASSATVAPASSLMKLTRQRTLIALTTFTILAAFVVALTTRRSGDHGSAAVVAGMDTVVQDALEGRRRIVVLPFSSLSAGEDDEYFADGLTEELLVTLGRAPGVSVTARASAFSFRDTPSSLEEIARTLGVDHLVIGAVRRADDDLRITVQLIRASDGEQRWSQSYDRTMDDIFAIQQDIAENIVAALEIVLDDAARARMRTAGLRDVEAFIAYQKGLEHYLRAHTPGARLMAELRAADSYFETAVSRSPGFANAWALRTDFQYHLLLGSYREDDPPTQDEQKYALERVRSFSENAYENASDDRMRAQFDAERTFFSENWVGFGAKLDRFLATSECFGQSWAVEAAPVVGRAEASLAAARRFMACDPLHVGGWYYGVNAALWAGDDETAEQLLTEYDVKFTENFGLIRQNWLILQLVKGNSEGAAALIEEYEPPLDRGSAMMLAAFEGRKGEAQRLFEELRSEYGLRDQIKIVPGYAVLGERQAANEIASKIDQRPEGAAMLLAMTQMCHCGAPFDLEATPNFAARLEEAEFSWPPKTVVDYPLKNW